MTKNPSLVVFWGLISQRTPLNQILGNVSNSKTLKNSLKQIDDSRDSKKSDAKRMDFCHRNAGDPAGHLPLTNLIRGRDLLLTLGWRQKAILWGDRKNHREAEKGILQNF